MNTRILLLALSLLPVLTQAQDISSDAKIDATLASCIKKAEATLDIAGCYQQATKGWDGELNRQYQILIKSQTPAAQTRLRDAQRAWLSYQQKYYTGIEAFYQQQQGTVWQIAAAEAKMNVIRDKALDLKRLNQSTRLSADGQ